VPTHETGAFSIADQKLGDPDSAGVRKGNAGAIHCLMDIRAAKQIPPIVAKNPNHTSFFGGQRACIHLISPSNCRPASRLSTLRAGEDRSRNDGVVSLAMFTQKRTKRRDSAVMCSDRRRHLILGVETDHVASGPHVWRSCPQLLIDDDRSAIVSAHASDV
jgi:hypothetical protein